MVTEITLKELGDKRPAVERLANMPLPSTASYRLSKDLRKIRSELKAMDDTRVTLLRKYGTEDKARRTVQIPMDNQEALIAFNDEFDKLLEEKVKLDLDLVPLDMLGDISITPGDLDALIDFVLVEKMPEDVAPATK